MIIVTRAGVSEAELDHIRERIEMLGMQTHVSRGEQRTIVGCIGDERLLQEVSKKLIDLKIHWNEYCFFEGSACY
jgi:3-deoxy-7-phosphoheptulonate synthase